MKKTLLLPLLLGTLLSAEVEDTFKIKLGAMFVTNFETEMQMASNRFPINATINTNDTLGLESDTNVFRLDGYYRFTDVHSIDFSYFSVNSSGSKVANKDFEWNGQPVNAGVTVNSYFNMDIYKLNYGYSFYHNEKVELMVSAGLHVTSIELGLQASANNLHPTPIDASTSSTIPLPVLGFKGEYTIIDKKLFVEYKSDYFALKYDNVKGNLISTALNVEYRIIDSVGLGLGYNVNRIHVEGDDGEKKFEVSNNLSGFVLNLSYIY